MVGMNFGSFLTLLINTAAVAVWFDWFLRYRFTTETSAGGGRVSDKAERG